MSDGIEFASNYHDLSTDRGFQFEFYCNRCHSGYRTSFKPWAVGTCVGHFSHPLNLVGKIGVR
jgi:hypothetical protein